MLLRCSLLSAVLLLSACDKKFNEGMKGPVAVPYANADWRSYGKTADFEMLVDANSVQHDPQYSEVNYTFVWMLQRFNTDQNDEVGKGQYRLKYTRSAIHCDSGRMAGVAVALHDSEDEELARYDVPGFQWEFTDPAKDSYGADFIRQVCKIMSDKDAAQQDDA